MVSLLTSSTPLPLPLPSDKITVFSISTGYVNHVQARELPTIGSFLS